MTSDERREVANGLMARAVGVGFAYSSVYALNSGWVYRTLREIVDAIGCAENPHPAQWLVRLADLIDPTCCAVHQDTSMDDELVCSRCGASLGVEVGGRQMFVPNFCSCCGARVVSDDDQ